MKFDTNQKTVVVPWDFSELSRDALLQAVAMADDPGRIRVVHVTQFPPALEYGVIWESVTEETIVKNLTESFRKETAEDSRLKDVHFTVLLGDPGRRICEFAAESESAVIVMPSHGRSGFSRLLLGSVAERVVRYAPCPVLILREPQTATETDQAGPKLSAATT